jgi:hypothetical protein
MVELGKEIIAGNSAGKYDERNNEMTRTAKTAAPTAVTDSAPDMPPDGPADPLAAAPPGGPAAAIVAALVTAPCATAVQLAQAVGISRPAATRELTELEKTGRATPDRSVSPVTWTARNLPGEAPVPDGLPPASVTAAPADAATPQADAPGTCDPGP